MHSDTWPLRTPLGWTLVLPVNHAERGKTRLVAPAGVRRSDLARAIAQDSLSAVRACPAVIRQVVVTSDPVVAEIASQAGDDVLDDAGGGLSAAIDTGIAHVLQADDQTALAVLLPDVAALRPEDLATALAAATRHRFAVVPDAESSGSVLLTAVPGRLLRPAFGAGSAARHVALGAHLLELDLASLRRDIDTEAALAQADALGLGPATEAALTLARARS